MSEIDPVFFGNWQVEEKAQILALLSKVRIGGRVLVTKSVEPYVGIVAGDQGITLKREGDSWIIFGSGTVQN